MTKTSVSRGAKELENLRKDIREKARWQDKNLSPQDFEWLQNDIEETVPNSTINAKTLKRFFGYDQTDTASLIRLYTLDLLSQYVGYANWDGYIEHLRLMEGVGSGDFKGDKIDADSLQLGDVIKITWQPDRKSTLKYLGNQQFEVVETENSKWQVGDTFLCKHFILGKPLYVDDLTDKDGNLKSEMFVVGASGGLGALKRD